MQVRKLRITIEYDPDWTAISPSEIPNALDEERKAWFSGDVTLQDLEQSGTQYGFTIEVVP